MPRNGVGGDRSSHAGWARQDYDASYDRHRGGYVGRNNYSDDINGGYSNGGRQHTQQHVSSYNEDRRSGAGEGRKGGDDHGDNLPSTALSAFEKRICGAQQEMQQMVHDVTAKDNQKFDLIFGILQEIRQRQAKLEDSVRSLKAQVNGQSENGQGSYQPQQSGQQGARGQQQQQQGSGGSWNSNSGCMGSSNGTGQYNPQQFQMPGSPMNQQQMGNYMMGQQFNGMMSDGSQGYFQPTAVVVAVPQNGMQNGQMSYMQPMNMQGMPQGMQPQQMMLVGTPTGANAMTGCGAGCGGCVGGDKGNPQGGEDKAGLINGVSNGKGLDDQGAIVGEAPASFQPGKDEIPTTNGDDKDKVDEQAPHLEKDE